MEKQLIKKNNLKRTNNLAKRTNQVQNRYLDFLIDSSFQGVNRIFVFSLKDDDGRERHKQYYLSTVEIKDYNVMIDGRSFFDSQFLKTYYNIRMILTDQGDHYTSGCLLLDYPYYRKYYNLIAIDLRKQQKPDADPKAM